MEQRQQDDALLRLTLLAAHLEKAEAALVREATASAEALAAAQAALQERLAVAAPAAGLASASDALPRAGRALEEAEARLSRQLAGAHTRLGSLHEQEASAEAALQLLKQEVEAFRDATERAFAECAGQDFEGALSAMADASQIASETCSTGLGMTAAEALLRFAEQFGDGSDALSGDLLAAWERRLSATPPVRADSAAAPPIPPPVWAQELLSTLRAARKRVEQQATELRRELDSRQTLLRSVERVADTWTPLSQVEWLKKTLRRIREVSASMNPFD